jgi:hypothetical protein
MARSAPLRFDLRPHTILLSLAGSRAQGLAGPGSDVDLRGVAVPPASELLGWGRPFEQADGAGELDCFHDLLTAEEQEVVAGTKLEGSVYTLQKFVRLCADCNPNMLEALFCRESELRLLTPLGGRLRDARHAFLSQKAAHTFTGYALQQLKRIQGHRHWLLHPPAGPPTRAQFGLPERSLVPRDQLLAAQAAVQKKLDEWAPDWGPLPASEIQRLEDQLQDFLVEVLTHGEGLWHRAARVVGLDDNLIEAMDRERRYRGAQRNWEQFRTWQRKRNPDRAALEAAHGYDTKHGAHLVRLLRMGREIVEEGAVHVWRGGRDAEELRAVRQGAWSYDRLVGWAEAEAATLRALVKEGRCAVPTKPDEDALNGLCVGILEDAISAAQARGR